MENSDDPLVTAARSARDHAVAPFSGFRVGVALQAEDGRIFCGANVETSTLNLGLCAERVALFSALAAGAREFRDLVIVTEADTPTPPCGSCRQILWEFAPNVGIRAVGSTTSENFDLATLLPRPFDMNSFDVP